MGTCFFVSDLHGRARRYRALFDAIGRERPAAVFLGGDLLPTGRAAGAARDRPHREFIESVLAAGFRALRRELGAAYPRVFLILGNDDPRREEAAVLALAAEGLWDYLHNRRTRLGPHDVYGYAAVPPTPFRLKDWERYDVSRYVDPGCVSPEEGVRSVPVAANEAKFGTIAADLAALVGPADLRDAILLFHSPPYDTQLDRAGLDGLMVEHVPLDVHVGSVAIRRLIDGRQPRVTLHGHVHESARLTGAWSQQLGRTWCYSAAHDGPELALIRFDPDAPAAATRVLL
jgi:Icc-related predicted phosphoesterase